MATELEQALIRFSNFTLPEILYANTSHSYLGVLEQLKTCYGSTRVEAAVKSLANGLRLRIASSKDIEAVDINKITNPEIQRLMARLKAIPLGVDNNKKLHLATSDPVCGHTLSCFSKFFSCEVIPVIAWESDIQKKLVYAAEASGTFKSIIDSSASMPILDAKLLKDNNNLSILKNVLLDCFQYGSKEIELGFENKRITYLLTNGAKKRSEAVYLDVEEFTAFLLSNSRLIEINENGFSAWAKLKIFKQNFSYKVSFYKSYITANTNKNNILILSDFSVKEELSRYFLPLPSNLTGIFFIEGSQEVLVQVLKAAYPAAYFPSYGDLQSYSKFAPSFPIFVSVANAAELLPALPAQTLQQVAAILHVEQTQQNCGFCTSQACCSLCYAFSTKFNFAWLELLKFENDRGKELKNSIDSKYFSIDNLQEEFSRLINKPNNVQKMKESPLFYIPPRDVKKSGFHSVVLNMGEDLLSMRDKLKKED